MGLELLLLHEGLRKLGERILFHCIRCSLVSAYLQYTFVSCNVCMVVHGWKPISWLLTTISVNAIFTKLYFFDQWA
jgi:hypothetical protein